MTKYQDNTTNYISKKIDYSLYETLENISNNLGKIQIELLTQEVLIDFTVKLKNRDQV